MKQQLRKYQTGLRGAHEDDIYGRQMAPMAAVLGSEAMIDNVIAYIGTFPDTPAAATVDGDIAHGAKLYALCANCHGDDGQGIQMNAPRQAGISDWYLLSQLKNFKQGQMRLMAETLQDEQAMRDVVAYINTL
jgi:cytochrome c oxidase subunit 2